MGGEDGSGAGSPVKCLPNLVRMPPQIKDSPDYREIVRDRVIDGVGKAFRQKTMKGTTVLRAFWRDDLRAVRCPI
jgi:hypothetical protein